MNIEKRNWAIYYQWIEGKPFTELALDFNLPEKTIRDICYDLVPDWAKYDYRMRQNGYRAFQHYKRKRMREPIRGLT